MFKIKKRLSKHSNQSRSTGSKGSGSRGSSDASSSALSFAANLRSCLKVSDSKSEDTSNHNSNGSGRASNDGSLSDTNTSNSKTNEQNSGKGKTVRFRYIKVKEFERIIGDNPSCSSGAPIAIGWMHSKERVMHVDDYESARPNRRDQLELVLTRQSREELLLEWGASFQEIIDAIRHNVKVKNQRRRTVNNIGKYEVWEEAMEKAGRKLKRTLLLQKSPEKTTFQSKIVVSEAPSEYSKIIDEEDLHAEDAISVMHNSDTGTYTNQIIGPDEYNDEKESESLTPNTFQAYDREEQLSAERLAYLSQPIPMMLPYQYGVTAPLREVVYDVDSQTYVSEDIYTSYSHVDSTANGSSDSSTDGFECLTRDNSFWEVAQGADAPFIRRRITPMVISEDGPFESMHEFENQGYSMQPPPYSHNLISKWE